jgi:dipeptidyl aminopeptidase/acylaminoacyl peptidase
MLKVRHFVGAAGVGLVLAVMAFARHKYRAQHDFFFPKQQPLKLKAQESGLDSVRDVEFSAQGMRLKGWYAPAKNGRGILFAHGAGGDRTALLPEARALSSLGFGVLLFDWPGHGDSTGQSHWNAGERASLEAAVDWLVAQPDLTSPRVGAYGFSMGGYVLAQVAANDQRLAAVVLAGTPADQREQVHFQHGRLWLLGEWPALFALERAGMQLDALKPIDQVEKIAPRAQLIIGGTRDRIVPPEHAPKLFARAREPKELLVIEGAAHGDYADVDGTKYFQALGEFFRRRLLEPGS